HHRARLLAAGLHHAPGREERPRVHRQARRARHGEGLVRQQRHGLCQPARLRARECRGREGRHARFRRLHPAGHPPRIRCEACRRRDSRGQGEAPGLAGRRLDTGLRGPARPVGSFARRALACLACVALFLPAASAQSITSPVSPLAGAASPPAATEDRIYPLDVTVNGAKGGTWVFIERNGVLFAPREAFDEWRVHVREDIRPIDFKGEPYWPLTAVPGFRSKVDLATQSVALYFDPGAFTALRLARELVKRPPVGPPLPAVFLNYDGNYTGTVLRGAPTVNDFGVLTEAGASTPWGTLTSTQVARHVTSGVDDTTERPLLRLETTLTHDFPETNRTLRIGDASTRAGIWGRNVYFGGVQFGTNFALTPGFISQPVPSLRGLSVAPSTVELYVNDVLRQVSSVPTGPFAIDNFPSVNGSGEARIVVRDLLGRETVVVQPFFANSMLLARELNDWSVEAGKVRRGLGELSDSYGES